MIDSERIIKEALQWVGPRRVIRRPLIQRQLSGRQIELIEAQRLETPEWSYSEMAHFLASKIRAPREIVYAYLQQKPQRPTGRSELE